MTQAHSERCAQMLEEFIGRDAVERAVAKLIAAADDPIGSPDEVRRTVGVWMVRVVEDLLTDAKEAAWGWGGCRPVGDWRRAQEWVREEER